MRCVKCDQLLTSLNEPCPACHFAGDPARIEELAHIAWLLEQLGDPVKFNVPLHHLRPLLQIFRDHYAARKRALEIELGLRLPPFSPAEARAAFPHLFQRQWLLQRLSEWLRAGLIVPSVAENFQVETRNHVDELRERLAGYPAPMYPANDAERLARIEFVLHAVEQLRVAGGFVSPATETQVRAASVAEKESLELALGLRARPALAAPPAPPEKIRPPEPGSVLAPPPPPPVAPSAPLRDRFWRTFLSERTLQAMLFLGIFLLFAAALSFVFWGWKDFPPLLRVAIPVVFTLMFYALGWYVRTQTRMYRSGIALTAIAALLIPIDFYTLYINFEIAPAHMPLFWLITSLACLAAYGLTTLLTQSIFFGYLVGGAAGSAMLALVELAHQHARISLDWRSAALALLAVGLVLLAHILRRTAWRVFVEPFRHLALIAAGVLMLMSFGWRYIDRRTFDTLHAAMTITWWLGGGLFGWGAVQYRSRSLGILAATALPAATWMAQAMAFDAGRINVAWHALGLALLVPLYLFVGNKLLAKTDDAVLHGHGRTATGWGIALTCVAALWSLLDLKSTLAAAASHAILGGAMWLAARWWRRPRILYAVSFFALTATTFALSELNFALPQLAIGWASLALVHILIAASRKTNFQICPTLVNAGFGIAAFALVPPLIQYDGNILAYALGNWIALAAWAARLAHLDQPGFAARGWFGRVRFHWFAALPLPAWVWLTFANRGPLGYDLPLALTALAWGMIALSYRLPVRADSQKKFTLTERTAWHVVGWSASVVAALAAFWIVPRGFTPALCVLSAGALYIADAITLRRRWELIPGALVFAWGVAWLADKLRVSFDATTFALALLVAIYFGAGLWHERNRSRVFTRKFLDPLYLTAHCLTLIISFRVYVRPLTALLSRGAWTDEMRVWEAAAQIVLGVIYALYAWGAFRERWAHVAAWLLAAGGGFIAISYSTGTGSLAARAALVAIAFVLAERALYAWRRKLLALPAFLAEKRARGIARLAWHLFRRPLLVTGWIVSVGVIAVALVRNLLWLGGRTPQIWAAVGLTLIVALYALSARLFRQARFAWFAALLVVAPWTILANLGWLVADRPATPAFAAHWVVLAWALLGVGLLVERVAPRAYALPLHVVAHSVMPFALAWGIADAGTSRFTLALGIAFYAFAAIRQHRRLRGAPPATGWDTRFLYPAFGLVPLWYVYLLEGILPRARFEHYGLLLITFGVWGVVAGKSLERLAPKMPVAEISDRVSRAAFLYALPAYLAGYIATLVGTLLVAHILGLWSLVLLYDALLALASARLFKHPLWVFLASLLAALAFWLAAGQANVPLNRQGWWLLGLAALYLLSARVARAARLAAYSAAPLLIAFVLIACALPPSSRDRLGAFWGYGGAAVLYALTAFWLRQPLLLIATSALAIVPYAVGLQESALAPEWYGTALFPGAVIALALGWVLDARLGAWRDFPWSDPARWFVALAERLTNWWALSLYALGLGLASVSPAFAGNRPGIAALNYALLIPVFAWAIYRFRLRVWLFAAAVAFHFGALAWLNELGWTRFGLRADFALRFVPVTAITLLVAILIQHRRKEESPVRFAVFAGWSHPLYFLLAYDFFLGQVMSMEGATHAGALVSLAHAILIALLASFWQSRALPYVSTTLGLIAVAQEIVAAKLPALELPVAFAQLALAYGVVGYALQFAREQRPVFAARADWVRIWEKTLQYSGNLVSLLALLLGGAFGINVAQWTMRALVGLPFRQIVDLATAQMVVAVFALLGLLYLTVAFSRRRLRFGYGATAMLIAAWMLHAFYVQRWDGTPNIQWYALPAGVYLLGMAFLEWRRGNKNLSRWIDYAAVGLMLGSLFWQTLLYGWSFAVLLGAEGFAAFWWGSARRLRRFLYAGMMGIILATVAQLINSLQSVNQWLVFGVIGLVTIIAAIGIERKMEDIKALRQVLETWE